MLWDPFLMKVLLKKEVYGSREQCTEPTKNTPQPQNTHLKKEENTNARRCLFISTQTGTYFRMWTSPKEKMDMQEGL